MYRINNRDAFVFSFLFLDHESIPTVILLEEKFIIERNTEVLLIFQINENSNIDQFQTISTFFEFFLLEYLNIKYNIFLQKLESEKSFFLDSFINNSIISFYSKRPSSFLPFLRPINYWSTLLISSRDKNRDQNDKNRRY